MHFYHLYEMRDANRFAKLHKLNRAQRRCCRDHGWRMKSYLQFIILIMEESKECASSAAWIKCCARLHNLLMNSHVICSDAHRRRNGRMSEEERARANGRAFDVLIFWHSTHICLNEKTLTALLRMRTTTRSSARLTK